MVLCVCVCVIMLVCEQGAGTYVFFFFFSTQSMPLIRIIGFQGSSNRQCVRVGTRGLAGIVTMLMHQMLFVVAPES